MLKAKVDAGATRAITQFFFENDLYFRYLDACGRAASISRSCGILPVQNYKAMTGFATRCGASVPAWLAERFHGLDHDPATRKLIAPRRRRAGVRLVDRGVTNFHFYTMNRADLVYAICHLLDCGQRWIKPPEFGVPVSVIVQAKYPCRVSPTDEGAHSGARRRMGTMIQELKLDEQGYAARASTPGTAMCAAITTCSI